MERRPRRTKSQVVKDKITKVEEKITSLENQITVLNGQKKELEEELATVIEQEDKEREQKNLKELAALIKAKKLTVEEVKAMIEGQTSTENQVAATEE